MKKIAYFIAFVMIASLCITSAFAARASGPVYVYYGDGDRYKTYTDIKNHMGVIGYDVQARYNWDSSGLLYALDDAKIVVFHNHGSPGKQQSGYISGKAYGIAATGGDAYYYKNVGAMAPGSMSQLKIAIMYGCRTGEYSSVYGNLPGTMVNKGAQTAVAWTVTTYVNEVNEWNRLFFEKAQTDNIVESFRHADYWLRSILGDTAANRMQQNRNEKGDIYGYVF